MRELRDLVRDLPEIERSARVESDGVFAVHLPMRSNNVVLAMLEPADGPQPR